MLDVLDGVAVHALRGERQNYKPLKSVLFSDAIPVQIAHTLNRLGFEELYVADLDAILTNRPNFNIINQITTSTKLKLMVDAGLTDLKRAKKLLENNAAKIVIGTETLRSANFVNTAISSLGSDRIIVSLDLKNRQLLRNFEKEKNLNLIKLPKAFQEMGLKQMIVLDLARVGSNEGVDMPLLKKLLGETKLDILVGGGVRNLEDLLELEKLGISGVLLATALYSGKITVEELRQAGFGLE